MPNVAHAFSQQPSAPAVGAGASSQRQGQKKRNALVFGGLGAAIVVLLAVICILFVIPSQPDTPSSSSSAKGDTEYGNQLLAIYDAMAGLDSRISECASEFNNNYAKPDMSLRQGYANTAKQVEADIQSQISKLDKLKAKDNKQYKTDTQHVSELLDDLYNRIRVINQAWTNSLAYSNPQPYMESIIAPITADNVGGSNKYYTHFKDNYAKWKFSVS